MPKEGAESTTLTIANPELTVIIFTVTTVPVTVSTRVHTRPHTLQTLAALQIISIPMTYPAAMAAAMATAMTIKMSHPSTQKGRTGLHMQIATARAHGRSTSHAAAAIIATLTRTSKGRGLV